MFFFHQLKYLIFSYVVFSCFSLSAQQLSHQVISSFGGSIIKNNLYLSQTAGQGSLHVQSQKEGVILHQGFEQALSLYTSDNRYIAIKVRVFPNPNAGKFSIATNLERDITYDMALYDAMGKIVHRDQLGSGILQQVTLSNEVSPGAYTLCVTTEKGYTGTTKIIIH
jgi:hypothetical protein